MSPSPSGTLHAPAPGNAGACSIGVVLLANICFALSMLPFFSPAAVKSDLQLPVYLIAATIFLWDLLRGEFYLRKTELALLLVALLSVFYVNVFYDFRYEPMKRMALLAAFLVYYVFSRYWSRISAGAITAGVAVLFATALLHKLFPEAWVGLVSGRVVNDMRGAFDGSVRGISGLAPESGFLGAISVYAMILIYNLHDEKRLSSGPALAMAAASMWMLAAASSGTGLVMFAAFIILLLAYERDWRIKSMALFLLGAGVALALGGVGEGSRQQALLSAMIESPVSWLVEDQSLLFRLAPLVTGVLSIVDGNWFGNGGGSLGALSADLISRYFQAADLGAVLDRLEGLDSSALGQYLAEMGVVFLLLMAFLYSRPAATKARLITKLISVPFLLGSFSVAFPPLWAMLAIAAAPPVRHGEAR